MKNNLDDKVEKIAWVTLAAIIYLPLSFFSLLLCVRIAKEIFETISVLF
jgi:hypothetical protein